MELKIGIVGSRNYPYLEDVDLLVAKIAADTKRQALIVSGGAKGVDKAAETAALKYGLKVRSYRVASLDDDRHFPELWEFGGAAPQVRVLLEEPCWRDYEACLAYRNALIIEDSHRIVAFWNRHSSGTSLALDFAEGAGRPAKIYDLDKRFLG